MAQLSYSIDIAPVAFPGQPYDLSPMDVVSEAAEGALVYGTVASQGTADNQVMTPAGAGDLSAANVRGIVLADQAREQLVGGDTDGQHSDEDAVPLMRMGRVWVRAQDAVTKGAVVHAANTTGKLGSSSLATSTLVAGLRWASSAGAGEFALLEVELI